MNPLLLVLLLSAPAPQGTPISGWTATPISAPPRPALKRPYMTWVTGEVPGADVIFEVRFDPRIEYSARVRVKVVEPRHVPLDGIDFVPGAPEVAVGIPAKIIAHYSLATGAVLPDFIPDTDAIAAPPASPGTWPSTVLSTPTHFHYVENQFGFGATVSHRIMRKDWGGGPEEVVYDGALHGLKNFEGLELLPPRLYFFAEDPLMPTKRALISVGLTGMGLWDGMPPVVEIGGLTEDPASTDGSDELDFDPVSGLVFGTNIVNGEMIAFDPAASAEVSAPGAVHFIDGAEIAASTGSLGLLAGSIDGVRSVGNGWLIVTGKAGVILSVEVAGVLADGADDADVKPLAVIPGTSFDDLTPVVRP
jgi:hypothetical protein